MQSDLDQPPSELLEAEHSLWMCYLCGPKNIYWDKKEKQKQEEDCVKEERDRWEERGVDKTAGGGGLFGDT